ncbi:MAG TPA: alpha/beta fold hydrolase [Candidatus Binataceae bacterium]|nr:alpha/beta fold hydrolase [Candidatus Binataceae bacterium]
MTEESVSFKAGALMLEGRFARPPSEGAVPGAVVCHPHPLYGGSMDNNVVAAILNALWAMSFATLRFNFRGVGHSEGSHGDGTAEIEDVAAAVRFLGAQPGVRRDGVVLAGYSFGARVALNAAPGIAEVASVIAVALPVSMREPPSMAGWDKPLVLVAGDRDSFCNVRDIEAFRAQVTPHPVLKLIMGADHFFAGFESELSEQIGQVMRGASSV